MNRRLEDNYIILVPQSIVSVCSLAKETLFVDDNYILRRKKYVSALIIDKEKSLEMTNNRQRIAYFTGFNHINRKNFCFLAKFAVCRKFLQIFHVVFVSKISVKICRNLPQLAEPKKSAQKNFLFYRKNLRFKTFQAFYRKIFRHENILDRIDT